jgi:hypothetical protein
MNKDILERRMNLGEVKNYNLEEWVPLPAVVYFGGGLQLRVA